MLFQDDDQDDDDSSDSDDDDDDDDDDDNDDLDTDPLIEELANNNEAENEEQADSPRDEEVPDPLNPSSNQLLLFFTFLWKDWWRQHFEMIVYWIYKCLVLFNFIFL